MDSEEGLNAQERKYLRLSRKRSRLIEELEAVDAQLEGKTSKKEAQVIDVDEKFDEKKSKYDQYTPEDIAYLEDETAVNRFCGTPTPHL